MAARMQFAQRSNARVVEQRISQLQLLSFAIIHFDAVHY